MFRTASGTRLWVYSQKKLAMGEEMGFEERAGMCALNRVFGFEPRTGMKLLETFGSAVEVFRSSPKELTEALGTSSKTRLVQMLAGSAFESAAIEIEGLEKMGCRFVCLGEHGYPALLTECDDPPLGLYYKGTSVPEDVFGGRPAISIVGTRDITSYGREWCARIVEAMSRSNIRPLIVSGLALGVDGTAHKTCLETGLPTVAVMATGIDSIYPAHNKALGEMIAQTAGCALVTDYPPGTEAIRINFLRRNRIIAGISRATILVESKIKGGGMMTARLAGSYGRDVYALPGRMDDPASQGCNLLVRENLAVPMGDLRDLMSELGLGKPAVRTKEDFKECLVSFYKGNVQEPMLHDIVLLGSMVKANRGISMDELCCALGWPFSKVSQICTMLECDGFLDVDLLQHCSVFKRI